MITKRFAIEVFFDDETSVYLANVVSTVEGKGKSVESHSLKLVLAEVGKTVRKRETHNRKFPPPEPSRIIRADSSSGPQLIVPARN